MMIMSEEFVRAATPSKEMKERRDKTSKRIKLYKHLEKFHPKMYRELRRSSAANTFIYYFSKEF